MNTAFITVTQLNKYINALFYGDNNLRSVFVVGEISNLKINSFSGHIYLTLKDDNASIRAVMFKSNASRLKFIPKEGMKVICGGSVSVYEKDGLYQLYISDMQPDGKGSIAVAFEQLKEKLSAEGLFDASNKKPIPKFPEKIAVITSETGAAVRDMINVIGRRWPLVTLVMCPVKVQGEGSAEQIIDAIKSVNQNTDCDLIIVGRGGGSAEDLWCFNDEQLAREVFLSKIPVISAVGHETDFTIIDFVADLRAPTPSAAAELAVPNIADFNYTINEYFNRIRQLVLKLTNFYFEKLSDLNSRYVLKDKYTIINNKSIQLDNLNSKLQNSFNTYSTNINEKLTAQIAKLDALSPTAVLKRGYSITQKSGKTIKSVLEIEKGDSVFIKLSDGIAKCNVLKTQKENNDE